MKQNNINYSQFLKTIPIEHRNKYNNIFKTLRNLDLTTFTNDFENFSISQSEKKLLIKLANNNPEDNIFFFKRKYFYNVDLNIKKGVFVPQSDTEGLVDLVINKYKKAKGLEVGFGTGAISIAIEKNSKNKMVAIDKSVKAYRVAKQNNDKNKTSVNFINIDLIKFEPKEKFDFLVSNPPYIKFGDKDVSDWVNKNQPKAALYAKENGLFFYKYLITNINKFVKKDGHLFFEIGWKQQNDLIKIIPQNKKYNFYKDFNDIERYLVIKNND